MSLNAASSFNASFGPWLISDSDSPQAPKANSKLNMPANHTRFCPLWLPIGLSPCSHRAHARLESARIFNPASFIRQARLSRMGVADEPAHRPTVTQLTPPLATPRPRRRKQTHLHARICLLPSISVAVGRAQSSSRSVVSAA